MRHAHCLTVRSPKSVSVITRKIKIVSHPTTLVAVGSSSDAGARPLVVVQYLHPTAGEFAHGLREYQSTTVRIHKCFCYSKRTGPTAGTEDNAIRISTCAVFLSSRVISFTYIGRDISILRVTHNSSDSVFEFLYFKTFYLDFKNIRRTFVLYT